jgi:menaquinone-specific isochorismate synthase
VTAAAVQSERAESSTASAASAALRAGLAVAARSSALSFIAVPAPLATAAAIAGALPGQPRAAWTSGDLTVVGIGCARELRGAGADRWSEVVRGARGILPGGGASGASGAVIDGKPGPLAALGIARPRLLGGAAFAPGAADRAPWLGFGDAWFMLPRWSYVSDGATAQLVLAIEGRDASHDGDAARWHSELAALSAASTRAIRPQPAVVELARASADQWREQIAAITRAIASGACSKIVAARTCALGFAGRVRPADLLAQLDLRHADCVRVLIQPPGAGALVAATPERLIRRDGDRVWCDALAGTRSIAGPEISGISGISGTGGTGGTGGTSDPRDPASTAHRTARASAELLASAKDRREHALVVDAIRAALDDCAEVEAPSQPDVRTLRHIVHLHTPFRARLRAPHHVLELAARLHPTPAVGGTPREVALDWIRRSEPVARGWYAAPVGWFDLEGNGELAVAIRSGVLAGDRAELWAGAGIVAGSDPDRELAETELKLRAMLGALGASETGATGEGA